MADQNYYHPHLWAYLKRVIAKKAGKSPSLSSSIDAVNNYKPDGFGVTVVGTAEVRSTRKEVKVLFVQLKCECVQYSTCLTVQDIQTLVAQQDTRTFIPSVHSWALEPKLAQATKA